MAPSFEKFTIGLDFGTNSVRALLVCIQNGQELASSVFPYPSGEMGILTDPSNPNLARQNPRDYLEGLEKCILDVIHQAQLSDPEFDPSHIVGIGVDTTGSTVIPIGKNAQPLCFDPEFAGELDAFVWLWKDHTAYAESEEITLLASEKFPNYLKKCGGRYSSEWWWSKILRLKRVNPRVFDATETFVEHCDWIPAVLAGIQDPRLWKRGICAAGHKAMFHRSWGGLPEISFLRELDPALPDLRDRLYDQAHPATEVAGALCEEWAQKLQLTPGIPIAVGAFDAHLGAVGAGIQEGVLVKILGTSTCDLMISPTQGETPEISGVCGVVEGSVMPGYDGIEAGQSAVGDIFLSYVRHHVPDSWGKTLEDKFINLERAASKLRPGESGLLALDWHNGNRTVLVDPLLTGVLLGQTLQTNPAEIYRAWIEATAFGARMIVDRLESSGVSVREIMNTGGLSIKNPLLMQIYADVLGRPMKVSRSEQTCALGAAICAAVVSGQYQTIESAQERMCGVRDEIYLPNPESHANYDQLFGLYREIHDAFGGVGVSGTLGEVMKKLIDLRNKVRNCSA